VLHLDNTLSLFLPVQKTCPVARFLTPAGLVRLSHITQIVRSDTGRRFVALWLSAVSFWLNLSTDRWRSLSRQQIERHSRNLYPEQVRCPTGHADRYIFAETVQEDERVSDAGFVDQRTT